VVNILDSARIDVDDFALDRRWRVPPAGRAIARPTSVNSGFTLAGPAWPRTAPPQAAVGCEYRDIPAARLFATVAVAVRLMLVCG
jgi:hypothetical protein